METRELQPCPLCSKLEEVQFQRHAAWASPDVIGRLAERKPGWIKTEGACPACVQQALLEVLLRGDAQDVHESIQSAWPLDAESAFGALPTPLRMHADPQYTGRGVTLAMVDSGFYPHPDLCLPVNRIRAWANASADAVAECRFKRDDQPAWPEWDGAHVYQWHGMMTSCAAAGNGWLSRGLYRGLACDSDVVLVQTADAEGRITDDSIVRALRWIGAHAGEFGIRVVNLSVCGDQPVMDGPIDGAIQELSAAQVTVVAAAGNGGQRMLVPPATSEHALTVGGLDDHNTIPREDSEVWHSNFGEPRAGVQKPEVVAPSVWVVAPLLPGTETARQAIELFERRQNGDESVEGEIAGEKLVRPEYKLTEGTSFASPIVASVICCMLEANPDLSVAEVRRLVIASAVPVPGASAERQGAGAVDAGMAVALAARAGSGVLQGYANSPSVSDGVVRFLMLRPGAQAVEVRGSWNDWAAPGIAGEQIQNGVWVADLRGLPPGRYEYKFLVDGVEWRDDPGNPRKAPDGQGRFNSVLLVPAVEKAA